MTQQLERAIERLAELPRKEQDAFAMRILEALEAREPQPWLTERHWVGGDKPSREETSAAVAGLKGLREKYALGGLDVRGMIEEGRR